jgi:L,D-transpeptidase YcbB
LRQIQALVTRVINKGITTLVFLTAFLCADSITATGNLSFPLPDAEVAPFIRQRISLSKKTVMGEPLRSEGLVADFYRGRDFQPAWSQADRLSQADMLIKAVDSAYADGLSPAYYHISHIRSLVEDTSKESMRDPNRIAGLDILLTDAFITLGCHLSGGCQNPLHAASEWLAKGARIDVPSLLEQALLKRQVFETLAGLRPEKGVYTRLKNALAQYRELASKGTEWPLLSAGPTLKKGTKSTRVVELRKRLAASGDLAANEAQRGDLFDDGLEQVVITFQKRHGLNGDGTVGREMRSALNITLKQRIRQMALNLERLRWMNGNHDERFITVNIADFHMNVIEKDKPVLSMKVVVGKPYQSTPVFMAKMTYIVINPSWNIPKSIVRDEILGKIAKKPNYLAEQGIELLESSEARQWRTAQQPADLNENASKYRFRQKPGVLNPLGKLKFMFPNNHDVYLHDTPSKSLFSRSVRAFSHGCIRIENPVGLAEYLLRDDPRWTRDKLIAAMGKGKEQFVNIPQPLNVHLLYLTAWVDEEGVLQFRNDIYGRDKRLDEALRKRPYIQ